MNFINGISRRTLRVVLSTVMMFVAAFFVRAQESSLRIYYKFDNATVYTDYLSNPASFAKLDEIVSSSSASNGFEIVTFSSPEGNFEYNARLAARRAESLRNWVYGKYPQLNGKVSIRPNAESWEDLRLKVESDSRLSSDVRSRILNIIDSDKAADASDMVEAVDVVDPGMVPVHPDDLFEGLYPVKMRSSSSMFKADHVCLEVKDGHMQAYLFMSSQSYLYMFPGTAMDAANAEEGQYISLMKTSIEGEELEAFLLPVSALDEGLPFSSYSRRKEKWYDRTLLFEADSLPAEAFRTPRYKQLSDLNLTDGEYVIDVKLDGGSGRASVESPAKLTVSGGKATAHIVWSSNNYDFMIVDGEKYMPVNDNSGNSAFDMPVAAFDRKLPVQADTTAMSQPHLIDYTLTFDSSSIAKAS